MTKQQKIFILKSIRKYRKENPLAGIKQVCSVHGISASTYYNWCRQEGKASLEPLSRKPNVFGNAIANELKEMVIAVWKSNRSKSVRAIHELIGSHGYKISYNTVRKIINDELKEESKHLESPDFEIAEHTYMKF